MPVQDVGRDDYPGQDHTAGKSEPASSENRPTVLKYEEQPRSDDSSDRGYQADREERVRVCLLYTSDAADDLPCVDLGGRRIFKKKKK